MPLIFNGNSIPGNGAVIENGVSLSSLKANNVEVWKKQATIYPGASVAKTQNLGWTDYFTVTNTGTHIKVDAFGGTERGWGRVMLGPFSSIGYSKLFFANLHAYITNSFSKIKVALGDINGNESNSLFITIQVNLVLGMIRHLYLVTNLLLTPLMGTTT